MSRRQPIAVEADLIETVAHRYGLEVELAGDRAYLRLGDLTFVAELERVAS